MKKILLWVALAALSVVGSATAQAGIGPPPAPSTVDIIESELPGGGASFSIEFTPSGAGAGGIVFVDCTNVETCTFDLTPPAALLPTDYFEFVTVEFILTEPGTNQISDQLLFLGFSNDPGTVPVMHFSFASDSDVPGGGLGTCTGIDITCLDETGTLQEVATASFGTSGVTVDTILIRVQSDVERTVPEPATLALLGLGLAGLGFSRRRKLN